MWTTDAQIAELPECDAELRREADEALVGAIKSVAALAGFDPERPKLCGKVHESLTAMSALLAELRRSADDGA